MLLFIGVAMEALTGNSQVSRALRAAGFVGRGWQAGRLAEKQREEETVVSAFSPSCCALGGECFISLLGKIHAFCMVDVNKKKILCMLEFSGNLKSDFFFPL